MISLWKQFDIMKISILFEMELWLRPIIEKLYIGILCKRVISVQLIN